MGAALSILRARDPHNQTLGVFLLFVLARVSKSWKGLRAYTLWNCTAVLFKYAVQPRGWERSLLCNSLGIYAAFRTASADAHCDFLERSGKSELVYFLGDMLIHFAPVVMLGNSIVKNRQFVRPQHGALALLAQIFFAYSQAGKMDLGEVTAKKKAGKGRQCLIDVLYFRLLLLLLCYGTMSIA